MPVTIKPYGILKEYIHNLPEVSVPPGQTVRQALATLGIPPEVVALVTVNDVQQDKDYTLQDGNIVKLLAVIGGG
jgi:sulfur carrier protein ThiS